MKVPCRSQSLGQFPVALSSILWAVCSTFWIIFPLAWKVAYVCSRVVSSVSYLLVEFKGKVPFFHFTAFCIVFRPFSQRVMVLPIWYFKIFIGLLWFLLEPTRLDKSHTHTYFFKIGPFVFLYFEVLMEKLRENTLKLPTSPTERRVRPQL